MFRRVPSITFAAILSGVLFNPQPSAAADQQKSESKAKSSATLTGCVDEQDGQYVLVDDRNLKPIANLEAEGFPTEGFARHMGHRVTVHGASGASGSRSVFKVRSIETLSDTCAPQNSR
jgi:hypothetical protein